MPFVFFGSLVFICARFWRKADKSFFVKNTLPAFALCVLLFSGCKKTIDELPEATQTGANTFGAKVDGVNWGPLGGSFLTAPVLEARAGNDSSVFINARNFSRTPTETEMEIHLQRLSGPGTYPLNQATAISPSQTASYGYYVKRKINVEDEWTTGPAATGQVVVTRLDWEKRIISGTFGFMAAASYGSAPLTVTEGRFDVTFQ